MTDAARRMGRMSKAADNRYLAPTQTTALGETGTVKLSVAVTYKPTGGDPSTQSVKVKLKKKL